MLHYNLFIDKVILLYRWLAVLFYVGFLTVTVLMMLNVLIAQMSDTYTRVRCNARALATFHRARFLLRYLCIYEKWWPKPVSDGSGTLLYVMLCLPIYQDCKRGIIL